MIDLYNNINSEDKKKNILKDKENNIIIDDNSSSDKLNQMAIIYKIDNNQDEIRLFGKYFVENNKNKCILLIDGQQIELCETLKLNNNQKNKNTLKVKLIENNNIISMNYMFSYCKSLISLPDIDKWNTKNVTDMGYMSNSCTILKSLSDISNWDTSNVNNFRNMFCKCKSLESLPDISKWNTKNVTDMYNIFFNCSSLKSLF